MHFEDFPIYGNPHTVNFRGTLQSESSAPEKDVEKIQIRYTTRYATSMMFSSDFHLSNFWYIYWDCYVYCVHMIPVYILVIYVYIVYPNEPP